jgi:hypothetical protein
VVAAFVLIAALHWSDDGLWFIDAPQHATNGLFWLDLITTLPADPVDFALSYYARYPVVNPIRYPPLFYILEGMTFAAFGASPQAAKTVVLLFGIMAGLYTTAWARRWVAPAAGWAGTLVAFNPAIVLWTNTVMLNVPATALGLATLFHTRRWLEAAGPKQLVLAVLFFAATVLTYYPAGIVLFVCGGWLLIRRPRLDFNRKAAWTVLLASCTIVPFVISALLGPRYAARNLPSWEFLAKADTWAHYWVRLPDLIGRPMLVLGVLGGIAGLLIRRWRLEASFLAVWVGALILVVSLLPARDMRYILLVIPAFVLAAAIAVAGCAPLLSRVAPPWQTAGLFGILCIGLWSAARVPIGQAPRFNEVTQFLRERAPGDAVLYAGRDYTLFGFYLRAGDPEFDSRLVRADQALYASFATTSFETWVRESYVSSTDEVLELLRSRVGCRWVAIDVGPTPSTIPARQLLHEAVARPEFELVRSFAVGPQRRLDLYRLSGNVASVPSVDLKLPSFTTRVFHEVVPIER